MSSGSAARGIGYSATIDSICSWIIHFLGHRVSIGPGQTALTRISGASALASDLVIVFSPPLLAQYAIDEPQPRKPATELTFTTAACGDFFSIGTHARVTKNGPFR